MLEAGTSLVGSSTPPVGNFCGGHVPGIVNVLVADSSGMGIDRAVVGQVVTVFVFGVDADNAAPCEGGDVLRYQWTLLDFPLGSTVDVPVNFAGASLPNPPNVPGRLVFGVTVKDSAGHVSAPVQVSVITYPAG